MSLQFLSTTHTTTRCRYNNNNNNTMMLTMRLTTSIVRFILLLFVVIRFGDNDISLNSTNALFIPLLLPHRKHHRVTYIRHYDNNNNENSINVNKNNFFHPSSQLQMFRRDLDPYNNDDEINQIENTGTSTSSSSVQTSSFHRRSFLQKSIVNWVLGGTAAAAVVVATTNTDVAFAAPPFAVIAEELGYYPIRNPQTGIVVYVPQRVQRSSTAQAIELARKMKQKKIVLAGTYWCPHTTHQKELLGREAFEMIPYLECSKNGYMGQPNVCFEQKIDGYPTWILPNGQQISGERPLSVLAEAIGMKNFKDEIEINSQPVSGPTSCP